MSKVLGVVWFTSTKTVGIVLMVTTEGRPKAYIGHGEGNSEMIDTLRIILDWGAKFPVKEAVSLIERFGSIEQPVVFQEVKQKYTG